MASIKFAEWDSLRRAILRSKGINAAGKVATILVETFLLRVAMCREKGLCANLEIFTSGGTLKRQRVTGFYYRLRWQAY